MRILFVSHSFPPPGKMLPNVGGMQRVATELYRSLEQREDVTLTPIIQETSWDLVHYRTPFFLIKSHRNIRTLVREGKIDTILFSSMVTALLAIRLHPFLKEYGVSTAAIVHGQDVTTPFSLYQKAVSRVFECIDAIFPVSKATGEQCLIRGLAPVKMQVVPNGVDLSRFMPLDDKERMRATLRNRFDPASNALTSDDLVLFSVGRQVKRKGFAWFIQKVMPMLPANVKYWLAGDGPEHDAILRAASEAGMAERIKLLGRVSDEDLEILYRGADLFIMPNIPIEGTMEGFGVVMLEAGACGMPTIASRLEGIQDVISEGVNGHFVESGNAQSFEKAISPYLENRERLNTFSNSASRYTRETYSWKAVAQKYLDALSLVHQRAFELH